MGSSFPPDSDLLAELADLGEIVAFMRAKGVKYLRTAGYELELGDEPAPRRDTERARPVSDAEADARSVEHAADTEADRIKAEERAHNRYWARITRASGAPIPPFVPGVPLPTVGR